MTQTVLQCDIVKICITFRGHNSAIMSWRNFFSLMHMFNACLNPTSNTVRGDAETRTVLQCDMVQNMYVIQGDVILI